MTTSSSSSSEKEKDKPKRSRLSPKSSLNKLHGEISQIQNEIADQNRLFQEEYQREMILLQEKLTLKYRDKVNKLEKKLNDRIIRHQKIQSNLASKGKYVEMELNGGRI